MTEGVHEHLRICFSNDVFILGAGFSRAISEQMPLMRELSQSVAARLGATFKKTISSFNNDIELAMTFLAQGHPWLPEAERLRNRALFLEASAAIGVEIDRATGTVLTQLYPEWLVQFVHYLHDHRCTVITLNYDTLLERAFQLVELGQDPSGRPHSFLDPRALYPIGFDVPGSGFQQALTAVVLKLHGSTNWYYSGRSEYFGEPLRCRHLDGWSSEADLVSQPELAGLVPLIVPPVSDKLGYFQNEAIRHLWNQASHALKNCRRVFLIGYSLPTTDLTMRFLLNSGAQDTPLTFVPVNESVKIRSQIIRLFPRRNRIAGDYIGKEAVKRLTADLRDNELTEIRALCRTAPAGRVEQLVRDKLPIGYSFRVAGRNEDLRIEAFCDAGLTMLAGTSQVRTLIRWECLETLFGEMGGMSSPRRVFGSYDPHRDEPACLEDYVGAWHSRSLGPWVATLLERAGLIRISKSNETTVFDVV